MAFKYKILQASPGSDPYAYHNRRAAAVTHRERESPSSTSVTSLSNSSLNQHESGREVEVGRLHGVLLKLSERRRRRHHHDRRASEESRPGGSKVEKENRYGSRAVGGDEEEAVEDSCTGAVMRHGSHQNLRNYYESSGNSGGLSLYGHRAYGSQDHLLESRGGSSVYKCTVHRSSSTAATKADGRGGGAIYVAVPHQRIPLHLLMRRDYHETRVVGDAVSL